MSKKALEAKFQTVFKHWIQKHWNNGSAAFELKRSTTDSIPTQSVAEHQLIALKQAFDGTLYYKIPDTGYAQKPFDTVVLQQSLAYVVVAFGARLTNFHIIPITTWNRETKDKTSVTKTAVESWEDVEVVQIPRN